MKYDIIDRETTYSVPQVAIMFGVSEATVRKWIKDGLLHHTHSQNNQMAFLMSERNIYWFMHENPEYKRVELTDEDRRKYLLAAAKKCRREISSAEHAISREMRELNLILNELFKEES